MKPVQTIRAPFSDAVFVCRKCARKAGAKRFRKRLQQALKAVEVRHLRVIEAGCFDLCPKGRIVVVCGQDLAQGRMLVVSPASAETASSVLIVRGSVDRYET